MVGGIASGTAKAGADSSTALSHRGLGAVFAAAAAAFLALQDPFSGPAAKKLSAGQYLLVTELALAAATPLMLIDRAARRDFFAIFSSARNVWRLIALMAIGLGGLAMYNLGLRHAHPVVVSAILNLSPFWAAIVARYVAGVRVRAGGVVFGVALVTAFAGSMLVAYSQLPAEETSGKSLAQIFGQGSWYFAIPVPIFTSLSGTLVGLWFKDYREQASIAAAILAPAAAIIPACLVYLMLQPQGFALDVRAAGLLTVGAISAAAVGRLCYQLALSQTGEDNGFVTMFFLLAPGLSALYSWILSHWIESLRFQANAAYFAGLAVTAAALFFFISKSRPK